MNSPYRNSCTVVKKELAMPGGFWYLYTVEVGASCPHFFVCLLEIFENDPKRERRAHPGAGDRGKET
jgi:hypothetical protein